MESSLKVTESTHFVLMQINFPRLRPSYVAMALQDFPGSCFGLLMYQSPWTARECVEKTLVCLGGKDKTDPLLFFMKAGHCLHSTIHLFST